MRPRPAVAAAMLALLGAGCATDDTATPTSTSEATTTTTTTSTTTTAAPEMVAVPGMQQGQRLDRAVAVLDELGLWADYRDVQGERAIIMPSNWQVVAQDPAPGTEVPSGSTVVLMADKIDG